MIREIKKNEKEAIANLWRKAGLKTNTFKDSLEEIESILKQKNAGCLVSFKNQNIVGTVIYSFNGKTGWIYRLAITPKYQSNGVGSKLLTAAQEKLKQLGAKEIMLSVNNKNLKVLSFYQKNGFGIADTSIFLKKSLA